MLKVLKTFTYLVGGKHRRHMSPLFWRVVLDQCSFGNVCCGIPS